ncbi:DUF4956 domain-containing protein [Maribellus comscasis]|uniref:DUF4956 domain-containing protein n=1 Tax=Maribellus comscasis TaxID=2681766 RepID=A0A6I6JYH0_9BACT|nr:DUF4956 domain-containing protein [Maribellus comscasis]QGY45222.1 DUF4956 domain-containing protein [Maribellus comscasis]
MKTLQIVGIAPTPIDDFLFMAIRFGFNLAATFVVVVLLYARNSKRKDFYFSYFAISIAVFLLCFLLENVKLELGFALGLFAIFGIIRYRTDTIPIKEMTYLFVIIAVSVINALSKAHLGYVELTFVNVLLVGALWTLEKVLMLRQEDSLLVIYENIENLHKEKEKELVADLENRTGIKIKRYQVEKIDFLRDVAQIMIYFDVKNSTKQEKK